MALVFLMFIIGSLVAGLLAPFWLDRAVVRIIRSCGLPLYSTAVMIAVSIVQHPEEWEFRTHEMHHRIIGAIWTGNGASGIRIDTAAGRWAPGWIERRIIREAVDWRLDTYIQSRIRHAMMQHALTGKITEIS